MATLVQAYKSDYSNILFATAQEAEAYDAKYEFLVNYSTHVPALYGNDDMRVNGNNLADWIVANRDAVIRLLCIGDDIPVTQS